MSEPYDLDAMTPADMGARPEDYEPTLHDKLTALLAWQPDLARAEITDPCPCCQAPGLSHDDGCTYAVDCPRTSIARDESLRARFAAFDDGVKHASADPQTIAALVKCAMWALASDDVTQVCGCIADRTQEQCSEGGRSVGYDDCACPCHELRANLAAALEANR